MYLVEPELKRRPLLGGISGTYDVPWNMNTYPWHGAVTDYSVGFIFEQGLVLPLSGALYRVEKLVQNWPDRDEGYALLRRIDDEWAKAIAPKPDSMIAVLEQRGRLTVHNFYVRVKSIAVESREGSAESVATVDLGIGGPQKLTDKGFLVFPPYKMQRTVKYKVRRVVAAGNRKGIAGWIELDPEPIVEEPKP